MNKSNRLIYIFLAVAVACGAIFIYMSRVSYATREGARIASESFNPSSKSGQVAIQSRIASSNYFSIQSKADEYVKQGQYDQAIVEFWKAVDFARQNNQSEWTARSGLSEAYEKAERFDEAIKEIDWLISQKPREDVLKGLEARRNVLLQK